MKWLLYYFMFQLGVTIVFWLVSKRKDKRYKANTLNITEGFEPTKEVSIDPVTQVVSRVYINPNTGERIYIKET